MSDQLTEIRARFRATTTGSWGLNGADAVGLLAEVERLHEALRCALAYTRAGRGSDDE